METPLFKFRVEGADAEDIRDQLKAILQEELGVTARQVREQARPAREGSRGDPISFVALVLSIPAAALAAADLIDRIKKRKAAEEVLQRSKQLTRGRHSVRIRIEKPDGTVIELESAHSDDLLDTGET